MVFSLSPLFLTHVAVLFSVCVHILLYSVHHYTNRKSSHNHFFITSSWPMLRSIIKHQDRIVIVLSLSLALSISLFLPNHFTCWLFFFCSSQQYWVNRASLSCLYVCANGDDNLWMAKRKKWSTRAKNTVMRPWYVHSVQNDRLFVVFMRDWWVAGEWVVALRKDFLYSCLRFFFYRIRFSAHLLSSRYISRIIFALKEGISIFLNSITGSFASHFSTHFL